MGRLCAPAAVLVIAALASGCGRGDARSLPSDSTPAAGRSQVAASQPSPAVPPRSAKPAAAIAAGAASQTGERQAATPSPAAKPRNRSTEDLLRGEIASWMKTPYLDNGTNRRGIGTAAFVRAVSRNALEIDLPQTIDGQLRTGKLVERAALLPGDLVFFDGTGFGPFRSKVVGIFLGKDQVALATKGLGVAVEPIGQLRDLTFKTARRIDPSIAAPSFAAADYGSNRTALLRDIAKAWVGTLYKQGGTTFDGIGNDEFVREIYEAIYDAELEGTPKTWATSGKPVRREQLEPGDVILYEAVGIGSIVNQRHAGMYIGNGEFVHSMKGSAVTVSKLSDPRWSKAYKAARRFDPDVMATAAAPRSQDAPPLPTAAAKTSESATSSAAGREYTDDERGLRAAVEPWRGTPYKIGGTSKSGVDCSALVRAVYKDVYTVDLPRTAEEQESLGFKVDRKNLQTGDLVFFRTQGMGPFFKSRHVGIYLGHGEFAQASGRLGVNVARLDNRYWNKKYEGAKRPPKA